MSDYLFCTSNPKTPGVIHIRATKYDPRHETLEVKMRRRELGPHVLEWTLPVVNRDLSEAKARFAAPVDPRGIAARRAHLISFRRGAERSKRMAV